MRIGVTANPHKPLALALARRAIDLVGERAEIVLSTETRDELGADRPASSLEELAADALIVLGGDGTILYTLRRTRVPILPINAGTVGFLAEIEGRPDASFDGAIERLLRGAYYVEERMRLAGSIAGRPLPDATNEVVVHSGQVARMRLYEILVDHRPVGTVRADGIIAATATGSTSYALSALGPIVDPWIDGIVLAGLAPFPSTPRAVLVHPLRVVGIRLVEPDQNGLAIVDGQSEHPIEGGETVGLYRSRYRSSFIRLGGGYFRRLQGKRILPWSAPSSEVPTSDADLPSPS